MDELGSRPAAHPAQSMPAPAPAPAAASASSAQTPATATTATNAPKIQQPKPQALSSRSGPSSILVSPRQKGNPILNGVKTVVWEFSDIPADYVLGATTCALFLSLKYHRLHPEYIYNRIRDLRGQYNLRILLTMVDIENHEESLRELSKTSLANNVTIMLCWSAQEAGRYLELYKTFEHAAPTSIRAQQSTSYSDKLVEFITVPRSINKTDALGLVSNFGSVRTAINAGPEEIGLIAGWGEKKVQRWCNAVREPFRLKQAAKRGVSRDEKETNSGIAARLATDNPVSINEDMPRQTSTVAASTDTDRRPPHLLANSSWARGEEEEEATHKVERGEVAPRESRLAPVSQLGKRKERDEAMSEGIMAALEKLRKQ
ncbi:mating-type switching protein swi10 [Lojkania enalia]|uniref:Mating-type switching protein swi10 n=1 Tax=Lojkania enalia TaxID=147567 RepID=A0A9P4KEA6_9PLEO|nr:mating-type switching protein swi10 [Didymosphaeria enalia]